MNLLAVSQYFGLVFVGTSNGFLSKSYFFVVSEFDHLINVHIIQSILYI